MATIYSYLMNGKKQDFADWIANISPSETPFTSSIKKEQVANTKFQWQVDALVAAGENTNLEGAAAEADETPKYTEVKDNRTQILVKVAKVSETSNAVDSYGRRQEMAYQIEKKGKELSRDIEYAFLNNLAGKEQTAPLPTNPTVADARHTSGYMALIAAKDAADPDTGAVVHKEGVLSEGTLFDLTQNLYIAGSKACVIMFHPSYASVFAGMVESTGQGQRRVKMFEGISDTLNVHVSTIIDPLGTEFSLVPNRLMPKNRVYIFCPEDFTQMVLRAPKRVALDVDGDYAKEMLTCEVGLRLSNPFAAGCLEVTGVAGGGSTAPASPVITVANTVSPGTSHAVSVAKGATAHVAFANVTTAVVKTALADGTVATMSAVSPAGFDITGVEVGGPVNLVVTINGADHTFPITVTATPSPAPAADENVVVTKAGKRKVVSA